MACFKTSRYFSSREPDLKTLKQAAPGNHPARSSIRRFVRLFSEHFVQLENAGLFAGAACFHVFRLGLRCEK
jgi:hypothetical protein